MTRVPIFLTFDHLIHTVHEPLDVANRVCKTLHWTVTSGGRHTHWGTYNALCYFGLSYLEWVGLFDSGLAKDNEFGRWILSDLARAEGPSQFALRTTQLDAVLSEWQERGLEYVGPIDGQRQRENGLVVRWRLLFPARNNALQYPLPFLIEWEEDDRTREQALVEAGAIARDGPYTLELTEVHSLVSDVTEFLSRWNAYFGDFGMWTDSVEPNRVTIHGLGPELVFTEVLDSEQRQLMATRGERPYKIVVSAHGLNNSREVTLHGMHVELS